MKPQLKQINLSILAQQQAAMHSFYSKILNAEKTTDSFTYTLKNTSICFQLIEEASLQTQGLCMIFEVADLVKIAQQLKEQAIISKKLAAFPSALVIEDPCGNEIILQSKTPAVSKAVQAFWQAFIEKEPQYAHHNIPSVDYFCDSKLHADICSDLVNKGIKIGTCGSYIGYKVANEAIPKAGDLWIISDWDGNPTSIIRTKDICLQAFKDVDETWARKEGEGDLSLANWQESHWAFFAREFKDYGVSPSEDMLLVCETFEKIF